MSLPDLKSIYDRCEPDGDCMIWTGSISEANQPIVYSSGAGRHVKVRQVIFELTRGKAPPRGNKLCLSYSCESEHCVAEAHLQITNRSALLKRACAKKQHGPIEYGKRRDIYVRGGRAKLSMEIARAVRASNETSRVIAERYGCDRSTIDQIRRGETWRELAANSSVFAWAGTA